MTTAELYQSLGVSGYEHEACWRKNGVFQDQREILCAAADCIARGVDCEPVRAKLTLSRTPRHALIPPAQREHPPQRGRALRLLNTEH